MLSTCSNANYNPIGKVTVKYSPLNPTGFTVNPHAPPDNTDNGSEKEFDTLKKNRLQLFQSLANISATGTFFIDYFCHRPLEDLMRMECNNPLPPLFVISSGRSKWISRKYDEMTQWLDEKHIDSNQGICSQDYFPNKTTLVPIYFPKRLAKSGDHERSVYIFVHGSEYSTYRNDLSGTGIIVVGWKCANPNPNSDLGPDPGLVGFGMSRAVVVNFAKTVRLNVRKNYRVSVWNNAWLIDDNVCYLNTSASQTTKNYTCLENFETAFGRTEFANDYFDGFKPDYDPKSQFDLANESVGYDVDKLVQQMVYMNIAKLTSDNYNFSPFFIFSNEDYALIEYLNKAHPSQRHGQFTNVHIIKAQITTVPARDTQPSQSLQDQFIINQFKNRCERFFFVYNQKSENGSPLDLCIRTNSKKGEEISYKNITEIPGKYCAKAVEQMFRLCLSKPNSFLPNYSFFQSLFQITFESHFIRTAP